jgi:DNA-directed RNA polymerase subunit RPC12/RpoP
MSRFPPSTLKPEVLSVLSVDAQIYLQCAKCSAEFRISVLDLDNLKKILKHKCPACGKKKLQIVRHLMRSKVQCLDCQAEYQDVFAPWIDVRCKSCQSQNLEFSEDEFDPPWPTHFGDLSVLKFSLFSRDEEPHIWGVSGEKDARRLMVESQYISMLPEGHRYLYLLILFGNHLIIRSERLSGNKAFIREDLMSHERQG